MFTVGVEDGASGMAKDACWMCGLLSQNRGNGRPETSWAGSCYRSRGRDGESGTCPGRGQARRMADHCQRCEVGSLVGPSGLIPGMPLERLGAGSRDARQFGLRFCAQLLCFRELRDEVQEEGSVGRGHKARSEDKKAAEDLKI